MNSKEIYIKLKEENSLKKDTNFHDSESYFDILFSSPLNFDESAFENKINVFCPYFLEYTSLMVNPRVAEWISGVGTFLKIFKRINPSSSLYYVNDLQSNAVILSKEIMKDYDCQFVEKSTVAKFDIIFSDGILNLLDDSLIQDIIKKMVTSLDVNGVLMLLINLDPNTLRNDFNLIWIHNLVQEMDMICVWGKYTFSSMWIKK